MGPERALASGDRSDFAYSTSMPNRRASRSTGLGRNSMPRPAGCGARVVDRRYVMARAR